LRFLDSVVSAVGSIDPNPDRDPGRRRKVPKGTGRFFAALARFGTGSSPRADGLSRR
jgi:hypothetical protein